jgi:hypothetical protein
MQFMPSTWKRYGSDANADGHRDPYNPVDAIFSAARYLEAAGASTDVRKALYAYNHADWYVDSVVMRARLIGGMPADLVGSLTGLTQGRFPVAARARYADARKRRTDVFARAGAAVVAVQDAKVLRVARTSVTLRDVYGNKYTYAHLRKVARSYAVGRRPAVRVRPVVIGGKDLLFAHRASTARRAHTRVLRRGARVPGGTVLGRIGGATPYVRFTIRPAGKHAPLVDPKPILDGWKLLESTAIYRAAGKNPLVTDDPSVGQVLLMGKEALARRVLADPQITLDAAGREDIRTGQVDRRVLATLEFLSASGLRPTVSCLKSGHTLLTSSGNISEHSSGNAVDISAINGIPILDHQGPGSIAELAIRRLLTLQGTMKPHQIISLMRFDATDNTIALPDHADHIHVGFRPDAGTFDALLKPGQWTRLVDRLGVIENPVIPAPNQE